MHFKPKLPSCFNPRVTRQKFSQLWTICRNENLQPKVWLIDISEVFWADENFNWNFVHVREVVFKTRHYAGSQIYTVWADWLNKLSLREKCFRSQITLPVNFLDPAKV